VTEAAAPPCVNCGAQSSRQILQKGSDKRRYQVSLRRCESCGLVFQSEWQTNCTFEIYEYFDSASWKDGNLSLNKITEGRYLDLLSRFATLTKGRCLLDIGCGAGWFVTTAGNHGWQAEGIDAAHGAVDYCEQFGRNVRKADIYDVEGQYDVCTMFEVIEHVPNPEAFLKQAISLVRPGGLLYVTTPNFDSFDRRVLGADWNSIHIEHLSYFGAGQLKDLLAGLGLSVVAMTTHNLSMASLSKLLRGRRPAGGSDVGHADGVARETIEASPPLRLAKSIANAALNVTRLGNATTVLCRKPALS